MARRAGRRGPGKGNWKRIAELFLRFRYFLAAVRFSRPTNRTGALFGCGPRERQRKTSTFNCDANGGNPLSFADEGERRTTTFPRGCGSMSLPGCAGGRPHGGNGGHALSIAGPGRRPRPRCADRRPLGQPAATGSSKYPSLEHLLQPRASWTCRPAASGIASRRRVLRAAWSAAVVALLRRQRWTPLRWTLAPWRPARESTLPRCGPGRD